MFVYKSQKERIWGEVWGDRKHPPCVLLAGAGCQGIFWDNDFCRKLASCQLCVIRFDYRDTGRSFSFPYAEHPYDLQDMARDVQEMMQALGWSSFHVVGISMGGMIAQILLSLFPSCIKSAVIIASTADLAPMVAALEKKEYKGALSSPDPQWIAWTRWVKTVPFWKRPFAYQKGWRLLEGKNEPFAKEYYRAFVWKSLWRQHRCSFLASHEYALVASARLGHLSGQLLGSSVLIIQGEKDPLFPLDHGRALQEKCVGSVVEVMPHMGHNIFPYFAKPVATRIVEWIGKAEGG